MQKKLHEYDIPSVKTVLIGDIYSSVAHLELARVTETSNEKFTFERQDGSKGSIRYEGARGVFFRYDSRDPKIVAVQGLFIPQQVSLAKSRLEAIPQSWLETALTPEDL